MILCTCAKRDYKTRDVIDAAAWRGDLDESWNRLLLSLEAEKQAEESELDYDDDEIDAAAEAFRYERDLITAEETEKWLSTRSLTLDDFGDYFTRQYWGNKLADEITVPEKPYPDTADNLAHLFVAELILSGDIDRLTTQLVWRLAAVCEQPNPDPTTMSAVEAEFFERTGMDADQLPNWLDSLGRDMSWFTDMQTMEAAYRQLCSTLLVPTAYKNELSALRLPLTRFETEVIELESLDAAKEALFCVTEDGMSMEEVAAEGRYPFKRVDFLLEDLSPDLQQILMSISAGELADPMPHGDGFELCRVINKIEPDPEDPDVKERIERRLLERHLDDLAGKHVSRRLNAIITE